MIGCLGDMPHLSLVDERPYFLRKRVSYTRTSPAVLAPRELSKGGGSVAGKRVSMRLWMDEPGGKLKAPTSREYETVGYVISDSATLDLEGQTLNLRPGDSWLVPAGASHQYAIIEPFTAVEATAPPAEVHGPDAPE